MINILLCDQNQKWLENFTLKLSDGMNLVAAVENGKKAQEIISEQDIDVIIINVATKSYSFFEVIKFIKQTKPKIVIVMLSESKKILDDYFYTPKEIKKIGISQSFIKPFPVYHLFKFIEQNFVHKQWTSVLNQSSLSSEGSGDLEEEVKESDSMFTSLPVKTFSVNNLTIFDLYIRLGKNKYIKIYNSGSRLNMERIEKYRVKDKDLRLHFKSSDRLSYVNYTNEIAARQLNKKPETTVEDVKMVDSSTQLFLEEVYTSGLPGPMVEESKVICDNIFKTINKNNNLKEMLSAYMSNSDKEEAHVSLTAFYTAIICKNVDWVTSHTRDNIILGALLHDIGKVKFSKSLKSVSKYEYSEKHRGEVEKHPEYGVELLDDIDGISEQVKQIVYQHHELNTGEGYPNKLTSKRIYPLAKIVAFANCLSNTSMKNKMSPMETIRTLIEEREDIMKYEPFVIKAFIKGFIVDV